MSKQATRKPLSIALGAAVATTLGAAGIANASETETDLFSMEELTSGYLTAGGHKEGGCGGDKGDNGDSDDKSEDEGEDKGGEGKCGEGKCGGNGA